MVDATFSDGELTNFSHGTNGRLQYDGVATKKFHVQAVISFSSDKADEILFRLAIDGTTQAKTQQIREASLNTEGTTVVTGILELSTGQYVSVFCSAQDLNSTDITLHNCSLIAN